MTDPIETPEQKRIRLQGEANEASRAGLQARRDEEISEAMAKNVNIEQRERDRLASIKPAVAKPVEEAPEAEAETG